MFGSSTAPISEDSVVDSEGRPSSSEAADADATRASGDSPRKAATDEANATSDRKRRTSSVSRARDIFSSAKNSLHFNSSSASPTTEKHAQSPIQKLSRTDPALGVPQGSHNNSAGESTPTARSTFRVGVTEDKNKKCRRTMEDTHAYLYNFLSTPAPPGISAEQTQTGTNAGNANNMVETDNGYFAIFDGHAGTFAADWCGKKLHHVLEETIRKNPSTPIPELLDQTFTNVDQQLEKLPLKNSGCTAVIAVLRWEDRVPNPQSATGSTYLNQAQANSKSEAATTNNVESQSNSDITAADPNASASPAKLREAASRQRVLYTANVGDARIVLCRNGRALRLSYDHKGSDENEGRRVANAGGLILNNRVNGVLAVTRALGDAYMKDLVTGHPYTTETVIQPDQDEFIILACDGLWDVCSDQEAVDLIRQTNDPQAASRQLVDYALSRFSTDNLSCMVVRFDNELLRKQKAEAIIGVEGDKRTATSGPSEAQSIVAEAEKKQTGAAVANAGESSAGVVLTGTQVAEAHAEGDEARTSPPAQSGESGDGDDNIAEGDVPRGGSRAFLAAAERAKEQQDQEPGPELNPEGLKLAQEKASKAQQS